MYLVGCGMSLAWTVACAVAQTGIQLIVFRALGGLALSCCLPSGTRILSHAFQVGRQRNIAFACLGSAQPVGFSLGLILGGVLVQTIGWRVGFWIGAGINVLVLVGAVYGIPKDKSLRSEPLKGRLANDVDWVGAGLASVSLGLLSYILA